jgi:hypothetical protein
MLRYQRSILFENGDSKTMSYLGFSVEQAKEDLRIAVEAENKAIEKIMKDCNLQNVNQIMHLVYAARHVGRCESIVKIVAFDDDQKNKS